MRTLSGASSAGDMTAASSSKVTAASIADECVDRVCSKKKTQHRDISSMPLSTLNKVAAEIEKRTEMLVASLKSSHFKTLGRKK